MALASQQSPGKGAVEAQGVGVVDAIEMKSSLGIAHAPGLVAVLDGFPSSDPQKYVDRPVVIRAPAPSPASPGWGPSATTGRRSASFSRI